MNSQLLCHVIGRIGFTTNCDHKEASQRAIVTHGSLRARSNFRLPENQIWPKQKTMDRHCNNLAPRANGDAGNEVDTAVVALIRKFCSNCS